MVLSDKNTQAVSLEDETPKNSPGQVTIIVEIKHLEAIE
jgi:hypothetical protein